MQSSKRDFGDQGISHFTSNPSTTHTAMSAITRSFTRSAFRNPSIQLRRGGGHAEGYNQPTGYLFGEKVHIRHPANIKKRTARRIQLRTGLLFKGNIKCGHDHPRQDITEKAGRHDWHSLLCVWSVSGTSQDAGAEQTQTSSPPPRRRQLL